MNLRDANPLDVLHVGEGPEARRVVVVEQHPDGTHVMWFWQGMGPHHAIIPHAETYRRLYEDEAIEKREGYQTWHKDFVA